MTILGLKTMTPNTMIDPGDLDALFSDDSDSGSFSLDFPQAPNTLPLQRPNLQLPPPVTSSSNQIKSLEEALPRIQLFLSKLQDIQIPNKYIGDIFFIPENVLPYDFSLMLARVSKEKSDADYQKLITSDFSEYPETIQAQQELLKYTKGDSDEKKLEEFLSNKVDSRILSLLHFALSKDQDAKVAIFHLIASIEDLLKFPSMPPMAVFFSDFSLNDLLKQLSMELVSLFPHHPILPSCIDRLSEFSPDAKLALDLIPESDDDDDFSDDSDFFSEQIIANTAKPVILLPSQYISNLLDFSTEFPKTITTVTEPPSTLTYQLENGSNQMSPTSFKEWVESIREPKYSDDLISKFMISKQQSKFKNELPDEPNLSLISYCLPVLHMLNSMGLKYIDKGTPFKKLLKAEYDIHNSLIHNYANIFNDSLSYFASNVEKYQNKEVVERIEPLNKLRKIPDSIVKERNKYMLPVLSVSDYEIAIHGRSPLTLAPICKSLPNSSITKNVISNKFWRSKFLYTYYKKYDFSTYVNFRIAFALALNIEDRNPQLALNILFEGIYILLSKLPLNMSSIVRSTYLLLGEMFDRLNSYYYTALMIDNFFLTDIKDATYSITLGRIAARNNDYLRSTYHYIQSLKHYISKKQSDESLYIAQLVATVYAENGLNHLAISLLSALLYKTYKISFFTDHSSRKVTGTLQSKKKNNADFDIEKLTSQKDQFSPDPHSLNTSLLALTLIDLLLSARMFDYAKIMLDNVKESKIHIRRLVSYMQSRYFLKQNKYQEFLESIPKFDINLSRKSNPRLSILSASTFDTNAGYLRMLAKMSYDHLDFSNALFWSEIIIHTTCKGSMKEFAYGNLIRGKMLYKLYYRTINKCEIAQDLTELQEPFAKFICPKFVEKKILFTEGLSSFYLASICFHHVGCFHLSAQASLLFVEMFTFYALSHKNASIDIEPPKLMTELIGAKEPFQIPIQFDKQTVNIDTVQSKLNSTENIISKSLIPIDIIHLQTLQAKVHFLKGKIENSIKYFEFAYNNIQKYFICGYEFIPHYFSISKLCRIHMILQNLAQLLFNYEHSFINNHLILFDILNSIRVMISNRRKSCEEINQRNITPNIDVNTLFLELANPNFPDFNDLLKSHHLLPDADNDISNDSDSSSLIILDCLEQIHAIEHLYEAGKLKEDDIVAKNRKLCQKIEMEAESYRRKHQNGIPPDNQYSYVVKHTPKARGLILVFRLFDKIYCYVPETGKKREIDMFKQAATISVKVKGDTLTDTIGIFDSDFVDFFISLTSVLSKSKHHGRQAQKTLKAALFSGLINSKPRPTIPDKNPHNGASIFGHSLKGALSTLDCGDEPVIILCSTDLQGIPFETILVQYQVIRTFTYTSLAMKEPNNRNNMDIKPLILRSRLEDPGRYTIPLNDFLYTFGGKPRHEIYNLDRIKETVMQPLFFSKENNEYYSRKYKFCSIIDNDKKTTIRPNTVFIFSYGDLCELPNELLKRTKDFKFLSFMFIPNSYFKKAMKIMRNIYQRHDKRTKFALAHKDEMQSQIEIIHTRNKMLTTMQSTLISNLNIPIPLFTPIC